MKRLRFTLVLLGIFMLSISAVFGQSIDLSQAEHQSLNISAQMHLLEDADGTLKVGEIQNQQFEAYRKRDFIFPFTSSTFWIKVELLNKSSENEKWVLNWGNPLIEELIFYEYDERVRQFTNKQTSTLADEKDYILYSTEPAFSFSLSKGEQKTIYLRLESKRGHYGTLNLYSSDGFYKHQFDDFGTQSFLSGMLIFRLLLIVIVSFFVINDKIFRAYSAIILTKTFGFWALANISGPMFSSDPLVIQKINHVLYALMPFSLLLFALKTLPMDKVSHWMNKLGYLLLGLALCATIAVAIDYQWYWVKAGMALTLLGGLFTLSLYAYFALKKQNIYKYYSVPLLLGLISNMLIMSRVLLHINFNGIYAIALLLFVIEIFVFIVFLGQIFKQIERKKFKAESALLVETDQNRKLQELDNLKTSFFTDISHELRTPLTLMYGPAKELRKKYPHEKMVGLLANNLSRLRTLVDELLDIQKLEANKMTPLIIRGDVSGHLRLLTSSFSSLAESKNIDLTLKQPHEKYMGCYDDRMLVKIVNNLLSNALKFTPRGGWVKCVVKYDEHPARLQFSVINSGDQISEEHLPRIFERFYQGDNSSHSGTGVGLALVKELVSVLKGAISVKSDAAKTSFQLSLPIDETSWPDQVIKEKEVIKTEDSIETDRSRVVAEPSNHESKELLLVVEDNDDMRTYIKMLLSDEYRLLEAINGKEGLIIAKKEVPDIIICDAMMPVMDGYEFSKRIKTTMETSHVPIVMLTAKTSKASRIESYEQGVDNYLTKPFDTDELKTVLKTLRTNRKALQRIYAKEVMDLKPDEVRVSSKEKLFLDQLKKYLEENYATSELAVKDLAAFMQVSDTQLRRKLKSISGYSPNEYLRKFRLEKAAQLLQSKAKSVSEVAYETGFENLSYFSKVFQTQYDCLPSEFPLQKA